MSWKNKVLIHVIVIFPYVCTILEFEMSRNIVAMISLKTAEYTPWPELFSFLILEIVELHLANPLFLLKAGPFRCFTQSIFVGRGLKLVCTPLNVLLSGF